MQVLLSFLAEITIFYVYFQGILQNTCLDAYFELEYIYSIIVCLFVCLIDCRALISLGAGML